MSARGAIWAHIQIVGLAFASASASLRVLFVDTPASTISVYYCSMCTVCGHPTMSNYFTMYYYKIVGVAVLVFRLSLLLPTIK